MHALLNFSLQKLNVYNVLFFPLIATTPRGCTCQAPGKFLKVVVTFPACECCCLSYKCDCGSKLAILRNLLSPPPTPLPPLLLVELEAPATFTSYTDSKNQEDMSLPVICLVSHSDELRVCTSPAEETWWGNDQGGSTKTSEHHDEVS